MRLAYRFAYFGGGFLIGIIILFFFLSGKKTSCDYLPNARVLKQIRLNDRTISDQANQFLISKGIDTSAISEVLLNGDVLFSESEKEKKPCAEYLIEGDVSNIVKNTEGKLLKLKIEYCAEKSTVLNAELISE